MSFEVAYPVFTPVMHMYKDRRVSNGRTDVVIQGGVATSAH